MYLWTSDAAVRFGGQTPQLSASGQPYLWHTDTVTPPDTPYTDVRLVEPQIGTE